MYRLWNYFSGFFSNYNSTGKGSAYNSNSATNEPVYTCKDVLIFSVADADVQEAKRDLQINHWAIQAPVCRMSPEDYARYRVYPPLGADTPRVNNDIKEFKAKWLKSIEQDAIVELT
jgi:hypothetical protein